MHQDDVPDLVRDFLRNNITSVTQLEILLLLFSQPDRDWSADEVSRHLANNPAAVAGQLDHLQGKDLIARASGPDRRFRFAAARPGRESALRALAESYRLRRARVIELIFLSGGGSDA